MPTGRKVKKTISILSKTRPRDADSHMGIMEGLDLSKCVKCWKYPGADIAWSK